MPPLLFINKSQQSQSLTKSTGAEKFLIGSHISRHHRKKKLPPTESLWAASKNGFARFRVPAPVDPGISSIKADALISENDWTLEQARSLPLVQQITTSGQHVDPFNSSAMRINQDAFMMIEYFLVWTTPRNQVLAIKPAVKETSFRAAAVKPNEVVEKAVSDELHMAALLSFSACLMDAEPSGRQIRTRIWEMTNLTLRLLRNRLQADEPSNLISDINYLAYTALYLGETSAARNHVKALKVLVASAGGYEMLGPHMLPSILYADICCNLPGLRSTIFDMSKHQLPPSPPIRRLSVPSLHHEAQRVRNELLQSTADTECKGYAIDAMEMAQVLHSFREDYPRSSDAHWVMVKCLTMLSNLLAHFQHAIKPIHAGIAVTSPVISVEDLARAARLEVTRICLILWLLVVRMVVWGHEKCDFMQPFETSLFRRYEGSQFGQRIIVALSSWTMMPEESSSMSNKLGMIVPSSSAARLASHRAAVITRLEESGDIRLGGFMNCFLHL